MFMRSRFARFMAMTVIAFWVSWIMGGDPNLL